MSSPALDQLARIVADGSRPNIITCSDGFSVSVIAGYGTYSMPRPGWTVDEHYAGPYTHVEVGYPTCAPEPETVWSEYAQDGGRPTDTVYNFVPVELVQDLLADHENN